MPILLLWPINQVYSLATIGTWNQLGVPHPPPVPLIPVPVLLLLLLPLLVVVVVVTFFLSETNTSSQLGWHNVQWNPDLAAAPLTTVVWRLNHVRFAAWIKLLRRWCRWEIYWYITETPSRPSRESHKCVCARNVFINQYQHLKSSPPAKKKNSLTPNPTNTLNCILPNSNLWRQTFPKEKTADLGTSAFQSSVGSSSISLISWPKHKGFSQLNANINIPIIHKEWTHTPIWGNYLMFFNESLSCLKTCLYHWYTLHGAGIYLPTLKPMKINQPPWEFLYSHAEPPPQPHWFRGSPHPQPLVDPLVQLLRGGGQMCF